MIDFIYANVFELLVMTALYLFLPLTALTFYFFRKHRREAEIKRIIDILNIDPVQDEIYYDKKLGLCLFFAVFYASIISIIGLTLLFLGAEIGFSEFTSTKIGNVDFPPQGSRFVLCIAFLGAYLWGLQHVFRRYLLNDLTPGVYYTLSIRMVLAAVIALVIYNAYSGLASSIVPSGGVPSSEIWSNIWPALALLIGMFPQRGLRWLMDRLPIFSSKTDPSMREIPLEVIEGITTNDKFRLEELGIDNGNDLANTDFVPLMINTPYSARELLDWILQAKLCVYFGEAVKDLRQNGIRTIIDLEDLQNEDIDTLAAETSATKSVLIRARKSIKDEEIELLRKVVKKLGKFTGIEVKDELAPSSI